jgi:hypothetical protein
MSAGHGGHPALPVQGTARMEARHNGSGSGQEISVFQVSCSRLRRRLASLCLLLLVAAGVAPQHAIADDQQAWSAVFVNGPVVPGSRLLGWFDGHARFRQDGDELDVNLLRPGVGWRVGPKLDLWVGYARIDTQRAGDDLEEDRAWQQATYPVTKWAGGTLSGRTRLEQRFRDTGDDTGWRLRQFFRYARPLASHGHFGLLASTEVFYSLNAADWGQRSGFDQNRALLGGYYQPSSRWRIEAGYMHQYIRVAGRRPDQVNHNLSVAFFALL